MFTSVTYTPTTKLLRFFWSSMWPHLSKQYIGKFLLHVPSLSLSLSLSVCLGCRFCDLCALRIMCSRLVWVFTVFPEWSLLNLLNSVKHDNVQKWVGYRKYSLSWNRYNPRWSRSTKKRIFYYYLWIGICLVWFLAKDACSEVVN